MDADIPRSEDELSALERRLVDWRPGAEGLDADAMLFAAGVAAGRSAVRRGPLRRLLVAANVLLAALAAGLGAWGLMERAERLELAGRYPETVPSSSAAAKTLAGGPEASYTPSPEDYFHLRQGMTRDPNEWRTSQPAGGAPPLEPPPEPAIFRVGQLDAVLGSSF